MDEEKESPPIILSLKKILFFILFFVIFSLFASLIISWFFEKDLPQSDFVSIHSQPKDTELRKAFESAIRVSDDKKALAPAMVEPAKK